MSGSLPTGTTGLSVAQIYDADHNQLAIKVTQIIAAINSGMIGTPTNRNATLAFIGDSYTARGISNTATGNTDYNFGFSYWAKQLSNNRFWSPTTYNFGVSGVTTAQMLSTQMPEILALIPDVVVVLGGRNDAQASVAALPDTLAGTITNNLKLMYDQCQAIGAVVIAIKLLPTTPTEWPSVLQEQLAIQVNRWIDQQALIRQNFYVVDCDEVYADPSATRWQPRLGYIDLTDNTHPTLWGAYAIGNLVAQTLNALKPDWRVSPRNPDDVFGNTGNTYGNLMSYNGFTGTNGIAQYTGATGTVASGWNLLGINALGSNCTASKGTATDGSGRTTQVLWVGGTAGPGGAGKWEFYTQITASDVQSGDVLEGSMDIAFGPTINIASTRLFTQIGEAGPTGTIFCNAAQSHGVTATGYVLPTDTNTGMGSPGLSGMSYTLRTPRWTVTGTTGPYNVYLWLYLEFPTPIVSPIPVGGTFTCSSATVQKVPPASF